MNDFQRALLKREQDRNHDTNRPYFGYSYVWRKGRWARIPNSYSRVEYREEAA